MQVMKHLSSGSGAELSEREAFALLSAMLDDGMAELELGAVLALLERKLLSPGELLGFGAALEQRCLRLEAPESGPRPIVFACYRGVRDHPHLLPLVALVLQRLGAPVVVHGTLEGGGGVAAAYVLRELGVLPCASPAIAQSRLDERKVVFVPLAVLAPGLAGMLALKGRLGFGGFAQTLARLMPPFGSNALYVVGTNAGTESALLCDYFAASGLPGLLFEGVEGEPFVDPRRRPRLEYVTPDGSQVLFDAEAGMMKHPVPLPAAHDAHSVARWIERALAGEIPVPLPLINQIACCLYGAGYTDDMNQAKAIVAVETGSLAMA